MICQKNCSLNCQGGSVLFCEKKIIQVEFSINCREIVRWAAWGNVQWSVKKYVQWSFRSNVQRVVRDNELHVSGENVLICEIQCTCIWLNVRLTVRKWSMSCQGKCSMSCKGNCWMSCHGKIKAMCEWTCFFVLFRTKLSGRVFNLCILEKRYWIVSIIHDIHSF